MRKVLISRSPVLIFVLMIIGAAAIILPHDINTSQVESNCPVNIVCDKETEQTTMRSGFPLVWKTSVKVATTEGDVKTQTTNNNRLKADIAFWLALVLFIGLFPIKIDPNENNRY